MARRILSFILALVTMLTLCAPAFAEGPEVTGSPEPTQTADPAASPEPSEEPESEETPVPEPTELPQEGEDEGDVDAEDADGDEIVDGDEADETDGIDEEEPEDGNGGEAELPEQDDTADEEIIVEADQLLAASESYAAAALNSSLASAPMAANITEQMTVNAAAPAVSLRGGTLKKTGDKWYCYDASGNKILGWQIVDGKKYFFKRTDGSGKMLTGWQDIKSSDGVDTKRYYFDPDTGEMKTGWLKEDGKKYYLKKGELEDEDTGTPLLGWQTIGGARYFFKRTDGSGKMLTGWQSVKCSDGTTRRYYFGSDGKMKTGWVSSGGRKYYLQTGDLASETTGSALLGWQTIGGAKYFFKRNDGSGKMLTGWQSIKCSDGVTRRYYFASNGKMKTGWVSSGGKKYYLQTGDLASEITGSALLGWQTIGGAKYFFKRNDGSGKMLTGWQNVRCSDGATRRYYFGSDGKMRTGWVSASGEKYYLRTGDLASETTGTPLLGWQIIDGSKYFFKRNDGSGKMYTGWVSIKRDDGKGNGRYYFNSSGKLLTGWRTISGEKYYLQKGDLSNNLTGMQMTGWVDIDGKTYYISKSSGMADGPTYMSGKMYMFNSDGSLQKGGSVYLCGKTYSVGQDGVIKNYVTAMGKEAVKVLNSVGWDLWSAYIWASQLTYYDRWYRCDRVEEYAERGFTQHRGNCYVMNSCLFELAKMLGYDVLMRSGGVANSRGGAAPHGWCEINIDGTWYVFDSNFHNETGGNGYKISYGQRGTWAYVKYGYIDP